MKVWAIMYQINQKELHSILTPALVINHLYTMEKRVRQYIVEHHKRKTGQTITVDDITWLKVELETGDFHAYEEAAETV